MSLLPRLTITTLVALLVASSASAEPRTLRDTAEARSYFGHEVHASDGIPIGKLMAAPAALVADSGAITCIVRLHREFAGRVSPIHVKDLGLCDGKLCLQDDAATFRSRLGLN